MGGARSDLPLTPKVERWDKKYKKQGLQLSWVRTREGYLLQASGPATKLSSALPLEKTEFGEELFRLLVAKYPKEMADAWMMEPPFLDCGKK